MTGHKLVDVLVEELHTTVWCECGATYQHRDRAGAVKRHEGHVWFQDTRKILEGDRK